MNNFLKTLQAKFNNRKSSKGTTTPASHAPAVSAVSAASATPLTLSAKASDSPAASVFYEPLLSLEELKESPSFLSPMLFLSNTKATTTTNMERSDSATTLILPSEEEEEELTLVSSSSASNEVVEQEEVSAIIVESTSTSTSSLSLDTLPIEIFTAIAMSSGFLAAMTLRSTNSKFRKILSQSPSWAQFSKRSPDIVNTIVTIETKLHQFDQLVFATWPLKSSSSSSSLSKVEEATPCIVHRTFSDEYNFLGGLSLIISPSGKVTPRFFEHRESLPCYLNDLRSRGATEDEKISHSCEECSHHDHQKVLKSEFVHQLLAEGDCLSHDYQVTPRHKVTVQVESMRGVLGFSNDVPSVSVKVSSISGKVLTKGLHHFYLSFVVAQ